eukprot:scaffold1342_cov204-Pinguiococcus_pyrenoidosus.AAC.15
MVEVQVHDLADCALTKENGQQAEIEHAEEAHEFREVWRGRQIKATNGDALELKEHLIGCPASAPVAFLDNHRLQGYPTSVAHHPRTTGDARFLLKSGDILVSIRVGVQCVTPGFRQILPLRAEPWHDSTPLAVGLRRAELASRLEVTPASLKRSRRTLRAGCLVRLRQALGNDVLARRALAARGAHVKAGRGHGSNLARKLLAADAAEAGLAGHLANSTLGTGILRDCVVPSTHLDRLGCLLRAKERSAPAAEGLSRLPRAVVSLWAVFARIHIRTV